MKNNHNKSIEHQVLEAIKEGKLIMKPKWHFVLRAVLRVLAILILFFILVYLLNFIGLVTHEKEFNILDLSPRGMHAFMTAIPWVIVLLSMFLLLVFYILVKKYAFVYRKPLLYGFFGLVLVVVFAGLVVHIVDAKFRFARFGEGERVPVLGPMHRYYRGEMRVRPSLDRMENRMINMRRVPRNFQF